MAEGTSTKFANVSDVDIDANGVFKYILIKVMEKRQDGAFKHIVRGFDWANYHADIYDKVEAEIESLGLKSECVGGGRIQHDRTDKKILVYGYSMGFGKADHTITVAKLKEAYPDYQSITFSNEGY